MADSVWRRRRGEPPHEATSFVGREAEIDAVCGLLGRARMVTLLGPGGVGKTRVAVRTAAAVAGRFRDGVRMVELAGVQDGELLPHTVGAAFGLPEGTGRAPLDMVVEVLHDEQSLLVLDTCEHLVDACAMFAEVLLAGCPGVRLLLTSRQAMDVPAEHALALEPLAAPGPGEGQYGDPERFDAVRLFAERAATARPGFAVTAENQEQVAAVCRRLDGIPLAIELAAVRLRALPLDQVLRRLEDRFRALGGGRGGHPRHRTLRNTIDWSHDLCTERERALWARLSVFRGGFDLLAAEQVCTDGELESYDVVDQLIGLVDKSVVQRYDTEHGDRYRILDTIGEYGAERLADTGRTAEFAGRHRDHHLALAEAAEAAWSGAEQAVWVNRADLELDNFRAALEYSLSTPGEEERGLRMAVALNPLWTGHTRLTEGRGWLARAARAAPRPTPDRVKALCMQGRYRYYQGEHEEQRPWLYEARESAALIGDASGEALATLVLGLALDLHGEAEGLELLERAGERLAALGETYGLSQAVFCLGLHWTRLGDTDKGLAHAERALSLLPEGECYTTGIVRFLLALVHLGRGNPDECRTQGRLFLRAAHRLGWVWGTANALEVLGWAAASGERPEEAAVFMGAAARILHGKGALMGFDHRLTALDEALCAKTRAALGDDDFARLWREGEDLGVDQAVALALGEPLDPLPPGDDPVPALSALTRREREVAALVHQGLTNRQIAEKLVISKRTADAHVEHILAKLGFATRSQIAALVGAGQTDGSRT